MIFGVISPLQLVVAIFVHFNAAFFDFSIGITTVKILQNSLIGVSLGVDTTTQVEVCHASCMFSDNFRS